MAMSLMDIAKDIAQELKDAETKNEALKRERCLRAEERAKNTLSQLLGREVNELTCVERSLPGLYTVVIPVGHGYTIVSWEPACIWNDGFEKSDDLPSITWNVVHDGETLEKKLPLRNALAFVWESFEKMKGIK